MVHILKFSNHMPKFIRTQKNTVFAFGEGESEQVFLKYLRSLYAGSKTSVKIDKAGGKDCSYILKKAVRIRSNISYNHSFILLDTDSWTESFANDAKNETFELIGSTPCLEGLFLSILEPEKNHSQKLSSVLKKYFQKNYLKANRIITEQDCKKIFPKAAIVKAIKTNETLKRIVDIMEGNF